MEIEIQIINLDIDEFIKKLEKNYEDMEIIKIHDDKLMNAAYVYLDDESFIRIRNEFVDNKEYISFTYKVFQRDNYAIEEEFCKPMKNRDSYNNMYSMLSKVGKVIEVEKKREKWKCKFYKEGSIPIHIEVSIDTYPGIDKFIEIETDKSDLDIFRFLKKIGYTGSRIKFFRNGAFDIYEYKFKIDRKFLRNNSLKFETIDDFIDEHSDTGHGIIEGIDKKINGL
jgi:hypothetical protein